MKNFKSIKDMGLVTALMTLGYAPIERQRDGKRIYFVFEWDENMENLKNEYLNNRLDVDAQTFNNTLRSVKSSIMEMLRD